MPAAVPAAAPAPAVLHMSQRVLRVLDRLAHELVGTSAVGAFDLYRAVHAADIVGDVVRVEVSRAALDLIAREQPEIATLWPDAFSLDEAAPVPAGDEWTPALAALAARVRAGGALLDVTASRVMVRLADGGMLVVDGDGLALRHVAPAAANVVPLVRGV